MFDANIFFPSRGTLAYSEANLGAGLLGVPGYWLTGNAFAAHNSVLLLSFVLSGVGTYYLVRHLTGDRGAATIAGICFAFCPYAFGHLRNIQLMMTSGIPLILLAFHRLADRPSAVRGIALGLALGWQTLACGYYGIFAALVIGLCVCITLLMIPETRARQFWGAIGIAVIISGAIIVPLYLPYVPLRDAGFGRVLADARLYSATWSSYLASSAFLSSWMSRLIPGWSDVLFPGVIATGLGLAGLVIGWRGDGRNRYLAILYGSIAALSMWESFGPDGGLYRATYWMVPAFSFLRAPARFGVFVAFALSVLAGLAISTLSRNRASRTASIGALAAVAIATQLTPVPLSRNPRLSPVYGVLAPHSGAVIELPVYSRVWSFRRTSYMLGSTVHWNPLVNAWSDFEPKEFSESLGTLGAFPTTESLRLLVAASVRYAIFHLDEYRKEGGLLEALDARLSQFAEYLRPIYRDTDVWLYQILGAPDN